MSEPAPDGPVAPAPATVGSHADGMLSKPERILATAERLFAETGHSSLTVDAIAREAGVSRGLLHYYFGSMEDILAQVVRRNAESSLQTFAHVLQQATSRDELIAALLTAFQQALQVRPSVYALYYEAFVQARVHERVREELATLYRTRREALAGHLAQAEARGIISLPSRPEVTAGLIISFADGAALQVLSDPTLPVDGVREAAERMFAGLFGG